MATERPWSVARFHMPARGYFVAGIALVVLLPLLAIGWAQMRQTLSIAELESARLHHQRLRPALSDGAVAAEAARLFPTPSLNRAAAGAPGARIAGYRVLTRNGIAGTDAARTADEFRIMDATMGAAGGWIDGYRLGLFGLRADVALPLRLGTACPGCADLPKDAAAVEVWTVSVRWLAGVWLAVYGAAVLACGLALAVVCLPLRRERAEAERLRQNAVHLEQELEDLTGEFYDRTQELIEARDRAEAANATKTHFLATMSHELRTPLNAIIGFSEIIAGEQFGPLENKHYKEYINDVLNSGRNLLSLVNDILDVSRLQSGKLQLHDSENDVGELVESIIRLVRPAAKERNLRIEGRVAPGLGRIWGDERALRQVLNNLVANAIRFTEPGGHVAIKADETGDGGLAFQVVDTGCGIPADQLPHIFDAFTQATEDYARAYEGSGLGLAIVRSLVEQHDGKVEIDSTEGVGTVVTVLLPPTRILQTDTQFDDTVFHNANDATVDMDSLITLSYRGTETKFFKGAGDFLLGRTDKRNTAVQCNIAVEDRRVSRPHARLVFDAGSFYLVDQSRRGTYIETADGGHEFVHNNVSSPLDESGRISLGSPFGSGDEAVIAFTVCQPDSDTEDSLPQAADATPAAADAA